MPWLGWLLVQLIGIVVFNWGANFLLSTRYLALPLLSLICWAALLGQNTLAVGLAGGGAIFAGTVFLALLFGQRPASVPRRQIWWCAGLGLVILAAVMVTAANGRVSTIESWALLLLGVVGYFISPRTGKHLTWWRWVIGLMLCSGGGVLALYAAPTMAAVVGLSPLAAGTFLAAGCLVTTTYRLWQQRKTVPVIVLTNAVGGMLSRILTIGWGVIGLIGGSWTVSKTTAWLTLPCLLLSFSLWLIPLLLRQRTSRIIALYLLLIGVGYCWLLCV